MFNVKLNIRCYFLVCVQSAMIVCAKPCECVCMHMRVNASDSANMANMQRWCQISSIALQLCLGNSGSYITTAHWLTRSASMTAWAFTLFFLSNSVVTDPITIMPAFGLGASDLNSGPHAHETIVLKSESWL